MLEAIATPLELCELKGTSQTRPSSSVAEHFHGKEGVVGSIPTLGSRKNMQNKSFYRSVKDRKVAGLCSGLSEFLEIDVNFLRFVMLFLIAASGIIPGLIAYLVCAAFIPVKPENPNAKAK